MNRIAIVGSGAFAVQIADVIEQIEGMQVAGYIDGNMDLGTTIAGYEVIGEDDKLLDMYHNGRFDSIFIAVGYAHFDIRERIYMRFNGNVPMATLIMPTAIVHPKAVIGSNVLICEGTIIGKESVIEDNVTIEQGVLVSHNSKVGKHTFMAGCATLAGCVTIGEKCFIGLNCSIKDHIFVQDNATIGMAAVVIADVAGNTTVVGNPARVLKKMKDLGGDRPKTQNESAFVARYSDQLQNCYQYDVTPNSRDEVFGHSGVGYSWIINKYSATYHNYMPPVEEVAV